MSDLLAYALLALLRGKRIQIVHTVLTTVHGAAHSSAKKKKLDSTECSLYRYEEEKEA